LENEAEMVIILALDIYSTVYFKFNGANYL